MAEETAFGLSFGDPRKYMGKSPLADVGQAIKTGLIGYGIQKSGLEGWLNDKGLGKTKQPVAGAVAPGTQGTSVAMGGGFGPAAQAPVAPPMAAAPMAPGVIPPAAMGAQPAMPTIDLGPPPNVGHDILDDKWEGASAEPIQKQDFNPLAPDTSNQMAVGGNDYQQVQGYGKLQRVAKLFGQG